MEFHEGSNWRISGCCRGPTLRDKWKKISRRLEHPLYGSRNTSEERGEGWRKGWSAVYIFPLKRR